MQSLRRAREGCLWYENLHGEIGNTLDSRVMELCNVRVLQRLYRQ